MPFADANKQREYVRLHLQRHKQWFKELKATLKCCRCGFSHPAAMEFHHRDPTTKVWGICEMVTARRKKEEVLLEIAKCDILCANCHAIEHAEDGFLEGPRPRKATPRRDGLPSAPNTRKNKVSNTPEGGLVKLARLPA